MLRRWLETALRQNGILETVAGAGLLVLGLFHPTVAFALGAGFLIVLGIFRMQESNILPSIEKWIKIDSSE